MREIRFVDLCAGLGGFHRALSIVGARAEDLRPRCVFASELSLALRELYLKNFPEVREELALRFPAARVRASLDSTDDDVLGEALSIYRADTSEPWRIPGDLGAFVDLETESVRRWPGSDEPLIPPHELLCAGFPCQPFSKSGSQQGFEDLRGTVFHLIAVVLKDLRPPLVLLENVGNFDRHDGGNTWKRVEQTLSGYGYRVVATRHKNSGGPNASGLLSPHHLGLPHHRERFFVVAQHESAEWPEPLAGRKVFPTRPNRRQQASLDRQSAEALQAIISGSWKRASPEEKRSTRLSTDQADCVVHWNRLLDRLRLADALDSTNFRENMPSFPIWGYELDPWHWYPFDDNPSVLAQEPKKLLARRRRLLMDAAEQVYDRSGGKVELLDYAPEGDRDWLAPGKLPMASFERWWAKAPAYATSRSRWPKWKQRFIEQNREWALTLWSSIDPWFLRPWLDSLFEDIPAPSHQKLEWNCKGAELDLRQHILQFRPSGLRVKRFGHVPALVAMTTTQLPVIPDPAMRRGRGEPKSRVKSRYLLGPEALQLQGFPPGWKLPRAKESTFRALGNAVHSEVVAQILRLWLATDDASWEPQVDAFSTDR